MFELRISYLAILTVTLIAVGVTSKALDNEGKSKTETFVPNNLIVGRRIPGDELVHQENVSVGFSIIGRIVEWEQTFNATKGYEITQVVALDQATDGTGASVALVHGGPGADYATLYFESKRFHGIYFTVQLYGKRH